MNNGVLRVLKNKNFFKLWFAQIFSQSAYQLLIFLLVLNTYQITGSNITVSILVVFITIPAILFGIYAGVIADRFSQKRIMYGVNLVRALLALVFIFVSFKLWVIYLVTFLISSAMQFFLPAEASRIPALVEKEDLVAANSLYISTNYASVILGYSLASLLEGINHGLEYLIISGMFLVSAIVLFFLPYDKGKRKEIDPLRTVFHGVRRDFIESWRLLHKSYSIYMPFIYLVFVWVAFSVAYVMVPSVAKEIFNIPTISISHLIIIPAVLGAALGTIIVERTTRKRRKQRLVIAGLIIIGLDALLVSFLPNIRAMIAGSSLEAILPIHVFKELIISSLMLLVGFGAIFVVSISQALLQESVDEDHRGRVYGFLYMCTNILNFLPVIVVGVLADLLSIKFVIFFISLIVIAFGILNLFYDSKVVKRG